MPGVTAPDGSNGVVIEPTAEGWPPLMFVVPAALMPGEADHISEIVAERQAARLPLIVSGDIKVFQLVDGRWQRLD